MGFIELFLGNEKIEENDIENFIAQRVEESLKLDYKRIETYHDPDELAKDVSAFANAEGGLILLGVAEERQEGEKIRIYPTSITWGNPSLSKETLENHLLTKISYKIEGLRILPVRSKDNSVIFLIDIPQSENPPHMCLPKKQYYKRHNFQSLPMEHYEVADLFGRRKRPKLTLIPQVIAIENLDVAGQLPILRMKFLVRNIGKSVAKHTQVIISFHGIKNLNCQSSNVINISEQRGGVPTLRYYTGGGVLHANPDNINWLFDPWMDVKETIVKCNYNIDAEDMIPVSGSTFITIDQMRAIRLKVKYEPIPLEVKEDERRF